MLLLLLFLISVESKKLLQPFISICFVIHKMDCSQCQGCYVGQTSQWLKQRITQHKSDCRTGKNNCAVVDHFLKTGHTFDYNSAKILQHADRYKHGFIFR